MNNTEPQLITTWEELANCTSDTHILEIDLDSCSGWIRSKDNHCGENNHYLSTHTFYGKTHKWSTEILQKCGFNVIIDNWDKEQRICNEN